MSERVDRLFLIAESKTMTACDRQVDFQDHEPLLEAMADELMESMVGMTAAELGERVKISPAMARRLQEMVCDFPIKSLGERAIEAFTGVVFRALDYRTLTAAARRRCSEQVRIISSAYGWLRPDDVVKAYRLDFTTRIAPDGRSLAAYWREAATEAALRYLQEHDCREVVDLMPGDAAKCLDLKRIGEHARIWTPDFRERSEDGKLRLPNAGRLKTMRGQLLRELLESADGSSRLPLAD